MTRRPAAVPPGPPAPESPAPVRWGTGDFLWVWAASFVAGAVAVVVVAAATGTDSGDDLPLAWLFGAVLVAQNVATVVGAVVVSRWKATGSPRVDLGFEVRLRDWPWLLVGVAIQFAVSGVVALVDLVVDLGDDTQELVVRMQDERTVAVVVTALAATVVVAPVAEELLYRGLLLGALRRRLGDGAAILVSSATFSAVHLTGVDGGADPVGVVLLLVGLFALAVVLATVVVRDGSLSRAILVHAGFNAVATISVLAG